MTLLSSLTIKSSCTSLILYKRKHNSCMWFSVHDPEISVIIHIWYKRHTMGTVVCGQYITKCFRLTSCNNLSGDNTFICILHLFEYIYVFLQKGWFLISLNVNRWIFLKCRTWLRVSRPKFSVFLFKKKEKKATNYKLFKLERREIKEHLPLLPFYSQTKIQVLDKLPPQRI